MCTSRVLIYALFGLLGSFAAAQVSIVSSIPPYASLAQQVAGEEAEVHTLVPPGASPHSFAPSPGDILVLLEADLIILNGGVDAWLEHMIEASGTRAVVLEILAELEGMFEDPGGHDETTMEEHDDHEEGDHRHDHAHDHAGVNPHIWLDPILMISAVDLIEAHLVEVDPSQEEVYRANAATLREELRALDDELRTLLEPVAGAPFVPFHDAWPYFAARYGLDLVVEIEPFPGREPSPAYLAEVLDLIAASGARVIFSEFQLNPRPAEVVAESAGVEMEVLDPLGGGGERTSYQELLRYNARVLAGALGR
ncbi:MAG: metal ABC transporter substrate-binding protein [Truepera sp.]|nr:metal ABC transporter substrate-binding protein [Truepera sp.]